MQALKFTAWNTSMVVLLLSEAGVVYSGIAECTPRQAPSHTFRQTICLGISCRTKKAVQAQLKALMNEWPAQGYNILTRNCMSFCRDFCRKLGVQEAPDWVDALPVAAGQHRLLQELVASNRHREKTQVQCSSGHQCQLISQSFIAALVKSITCTTCARLLHSGEARWHCEECTLDICESCAALVHLAE